MLNYVLQTEKLNDIMTMLHRLLNIRVTFFDLQQMELNVLNIEEMSEFCCKSRKDPEFDACCKACDEEHLLIAKQMRKVHIYHCHAGLLEGIVPLYDKHRIYLGAIVFGQVQDKKLLKNKVDKSKNCRTEEMSSHHRKATEEEMMDIGNLLKYLSEYICENELIRYCSKSWAERIEVYIGNHLTGKITLKTLSALVGKSTSFLSHNFPSEFGMPLKEYIRKMRMEKALKLFADGKIVRECAFELGYFDEFYFSREFKRFYGYPPNAAIKQLNRK